jgi:hypothetical protein
MIHLIPSALHTSNHVLFSNLTQVVPAACIQGHIIEGEEIDESGIVMGSIRLLKVTGYRVNIINLGVDRLKADEDMGDHSAHHVEIDSYGSTLWKDKWQCNRLETGEPNRFTDLFAKLAFSWLMRQTPLAFLLHHSNRNREACKIEYFSFD